MIKLCIFCKHCFIETTYNEAGYIDGAVAGCRKDCYYIGTRSFTKEAIRDAFCIGLLCAQFEQDNRDHLAEQYASDAYMARMPFEFYCPACSETSRVDGNTPFLLSPGEDVFECPNCKAEFTVLVQFEELMPVTDNSEVR